MLQTITGNKFFLVNRISQSNFESPKGKLRYYDPSGGLTNNKDEAAKFATLEEIKAFIEKHGIELNEFGITSGEAFEGT